MTLADGQSLVVEVIVVDATTNRKKCSLLPVQTVANLAKFLFTLAVTDLFTVMIALQKRLMVQCRSIATMTELVNIAPIILEVTDPISQNHPEPSDHHVTIRHVEQRTTN